MQEQHAHTIVIARYEEALNWISEIPDNYRIIIYNKGAEIQDKAILEKAHSIIGRPNIGRESEAYLYHLMTTNRSESGFTVFAQGDPFEHSPDFIKLLHYQEEWQAVQALSWRWRVDRNIPPLEVLEQETDYYIAGARVRKERFSFSTWNSIAFNDFGTEYISTTYRQAHPDRYIANIAGDFFERCGFSGLAQKARRHRIGIFSYGAIFAVKNDILQHFTPFNLAMIYSLVCGHPIHGYVLERLWLHIFGEPFLLPLQEHER